MYDDDDTLDFTSITEQANELLASIASQVAGTAPAEPPERAGLKAERIQLTEAGSWRRETGGAYVRTYRFARPETAEFWVRFLSTLLAPTGLVPALVRRDQHLTVRVAADLAEPQEVDDQLVRLCDLLFEPAAEVVDEGGADVLG